MTNTMQADGMFIGLQDYYSRYRPPVIREVAEAILKMCPDGTCEGDFLDLGTGTGQAVHCFAPFFNTLYAVELDPDMLSRAREDWTGVSRSLSSVVHWELCDVARYTLPAHASVSLVGTCRSFHWMEQPTILARYAEQSGERASFAVFGDSSLWENEAPWARATKKCVQSFLGEKRRARKATYFHHCRPYAEVVAESPFSDVHEDKVHVLRRWRPNEVIGYLYSTTFASRELFGDRINDFEDSLLAALSGYEDLGGMLHEAATFNIVVGTKP